MDDLETQAEDSTEGQGAEQGEANQALQDADLPTEAINLVTEYAVDIKKKTWLEDQAKKVARYVEADDEAREGWKRDRAEEIKLYAGLAESMSTAQGGGQSPHDPISTRVLLQLWSRGWDQICPAKGSLLQVHQNGPQDEEAAKRREEYMEWQLRHKVPNWIMGHAESYLGFLISGSAFREKFWNPVSRTTEFEPVAADDVIVPWTRKDIDPMMKRCPRVTRVLHLHRWQIEGFAEEGAFDSDYTSKIFDPETGTGTQPEPSLIVTENEKLEKVEVPSVVGQQEDKNLKSRDVLRCYTWLLLPDEKKMKPITFVIDRATKLPLALMVREAEDPFDRRRYESQKQEWTLKAQNVVSQYQAQLAQHMDMTSKGIPAQPPVQPQQPKEPRPPKLRTVYNMVHYRLFPNPAGFYGIGVGYLLRNANLLINKLEAEYLMSARLQNSNMGFLPQGTMAKRGDVEVGIGKWVQTELEPEQMGALKPFPFQPPSDGLWKFIEKTRQDASTLIADADTMSGEAGPTNETKAAAQQRQFNATALVSIIVRLYLEPLKEEVKLLAHDNRFFMDETEFYWVTSPTHQAPGAPQSQTKTALRSDFSDEFDFTFTADQRLQSQPDKLATLANVITQLLQVPLTKDPARGLPLFYVALKKFFQALDMPEFEQALGPPPPPPQNPVPPQPMNQIDETADFVQGKDHPVLPTDDHEAHLMRIEDFESSSYHADMDPNGKQLLDRHKAAHIGALYKQQAALHEQGQHAVGFRGAQPGMGGGPGNGNAPGAVALPPPTGLGPPPGGMPAGPPQ